MAKAMVLGGATGLLGQALTRTLLNANWEVDTLGRNDGDLLDMKFLKKQLEKCKADVVFNTIAWTQVDDAEEHEEEARAYNRTLPSSIACILDVIGNTHLIHYSTDFVFNGNKETAWTEEDSPEPTSIYGKTKLEGEEAILRALPNDSTIIRTAWLFGPGRKNFVDSILHACHKKDTINVVHDQTGSPTYTLDLANWSIKLAEAKVTGIWHAVNSGQASWCDLAYEAITLTAAPCRLEPIVSTQWPQKAKRPSFSVLDTTKLTTFLKEKPRPWPQALRDYLFGEYKPIPQK